MFALVSAAAFALQVICHSQVQKGRRGLPSTLPRVSGNSWLTECLKVTLRETPQRTGNCFLFLIPLEINASTVYKDGRHEPALPSYKLFPRDLSGNCHVTRRY